MTSTFGKVAIVVVLLLAIVGVVQLKQRQEVTAPPPVTTTQDAQASAPSPPITAVPPTATSPSTTSKKTTPAVPSKGTPATTSKSATPPGAAHTPSAGKAPAATTPVKTAAALPRLLELGSDSCRPCQMMQPVLAALRAEYAGKLQVDFIDVWKDDSLPKAQSVLQHYKAQAIPTQIFFATSGKELFRHTGYYPKEDIIAKFKEYGIVL